MVLVEEYKPAKEFQEDGKDPLLEIPMTDSTELWLIQWPINQPPDLDGQEVSLKLGADGELGNFENSSGTYKLVSCASQDADATVFLSSSSNSKVVGKVSRRVCLVHYPEPSELEKANSTQLNHVSSVSYSTPSQSSRRRGSRTSSGISEASMQRSSRPSLLSQSGIQKSSRSTSGISHASMNQRTSLFDSGEPSSKRPKSRHVTEPTRSISRSHQDSEGRKSGVTSLGSAGTSNSEKSTPKVKQEAK